jgi:hypothetical protein
MSAFYHVESRALADGWMEMILETQCHGMHLAHLLALQINGPAPFEFLHGVP